MAAVRVRRDEFAGGGLPPVCVRTGAHADTAVPARAVRVPPWSWPLLLVGVIPFLAALFFGLRLVDGGLPMSRQSMEEVTLLRQASRALTATAVALLFLWLPADWPVLGLLGAAALSAALVVWLARRDRMPTIQLRGDDIVLRRVHPSFATAARRQRSHDASTFWAGDPPREGPPGEEL